MDKGLVPRRDLYLKTNSIHKTETAMSPARFETAIQQASGPIPTPYTARSLELVFALITYTCFPFRPYIILTVEQVH
jgi:hypothetical protein